MKKIVKTYKASGGQTVSIIIERPVPSGKDLDWLKLQQTRFQAEAEIIADALFAGLPGGLLDRLTAELCKRFASDLIVPSLRTTRGVQE